ncbi:MAG: insulinase family protein [Frankiales bacterium]|nr:insulinase family protein [Frankiales bacterium]
MPIELAAREQRPGSTRTLATGPDGGVVRRTVLPGGLRVISESVPGVRSVAFGIWVGVGSRDETLSLSGASHYLEHLLFKGTQRRDALSIAAEIEAVGGEINAFTAKEYTCYYARVLDEDLPLAVDVVCDMVSGSLIATPDVENERGVILEEIAMHDDDPGDAVHDAFAELVWPGTPLGRPVLGTVSSIESLSRASIAGYYRRRYRPDSLVIAAAGNLDHAALVRLVRKAFAAVEVEADRAPSAPRLGGRGPGFTSGTSVVRRPTEQANLVLGLPGLPRLDERRFALSVLNAALGGGMSSRLFQEVREKRGLAYSVYSFTSQYADTGLVGVYAGCHPKRATDVLELCREQLTLAASGGITAEELERGRGQMRGGLVLGLEDTGSRMSRLGKSELVYGELMTIDEILSRLAEVTLDDVRAVAFDLLRGPAALAAIGPYDDDRALSAAVA